MQFYGLPEAIPRGAIYLNVTVHGKSYVVVFVNDVTTELYCLSLRP